MFQSIMNRTLLKHAPLNAIGVGVAAVALATVAACDMGNIPTDAGVEPEAQAVEINFAAMVGAETFSCGETYSGVGTTNSDVTPLDFRLYVHDVRLINADGDEVAVTLENDGKWQTDRVTMLDFEDASGSCANGNPDLNSKIFGTVPAGTYDGLAFRIGVPFEDNHADVTLAPSPLNTPSMFWNWQGGYKFVRIDNSSAGMQGGFNVHVGSTGCDGDMQGNVTACTNENRSSISLDTFDPANDVVELDMAALLAGVDMESNTVDTPPGCMSTPTDPECTSIFDSLGIEGGSRSFVSVR